MNIAEKQVASRLLGEKVLGGGKKSRGVDKRKHKSSSNGSYNSNDSLSELNNMFAKTNIKRQKKRNELGDVMYQELGPRSRRRPEFLDPSVPAARSRAKRRPEARQHSTSPPAARGLASKPLVNQKRKRTSNNSTNSQSENKKQVFNLSEIANALNNATRTVSRSRTPPQPVIPRTPTPNIIRNLTQSMGNLYIDRRRRPRGNTARRNRRHT